MKILQLAVLALLGVNAIQKKTDSSIKKLDGDLPAPLDNDEFMTEFLRNNGDKDSKGRITVSRANAEKYATTLLEKDGGLKPYYAK